MNRKLGFYQPKKCDWKEAIKRAMKLKEKIKAKEIVNMRIARGGCFVARFLLDVKKINGIEHDVMTEIKVYDNIKVR